MPVIKLKTEINAPIEICFDLSRSIDLHAISTAGTNEEAIAGRTSGLINLNETVTWQATHFGIRQKLTSKITAFERPVYFVDEQVNGIFKSIFHQHHFEQTGDKTIMTDIFEFHAPYGILGKLFNKLVLKTYMKNFLIKRNGIIREFAESGKWKVILNENQ